MIHGFWGRKVGMTQVFAENNKVLPVTAVDVSGWIVTQIKTEDKDGYDAIQVGYLRNKYQGKSFQQEWLEKKSKYLRWIKEITISKQPENLKIGQAFDFSNIVQEKDKVDVTGTSKGCGFAGVVRRHNFSGGPASHGAKTGRRPGSIGFMCATGKVIKGKAMPGHMGVDKKTTKNLQVVQIKTEDSIVLIKGSMAGKSGSLVYVRKCG